MLCTPMVDHENRPAPSSVQWLATALNERRLVEGWCAAQREEKFGELTSLLEKSFFQKYDTIGYYNHLLQTTVREMLWV